MRNGTRSPFTRVDEKMAGIDPRLLALLARALCGALGPHLGDSSSYLLGPGIVRQNFLDEGMLRGAHHEGDAVDGVGPGGEHRTGFAGGLEPEVDSRALAPANPVSLLLPDVLGPAGQALKIVEKALGVVGDLEKPLAEPALFHLGTAPPGDAVVDLLVGEDGFVHRIPVHERLALVGEPPLEHLEENPLGPTIVARMGGGNFPGPIVGQARNPELGGAC